MEQKNPFACYDRGFLIRTLIVAAILVLVTFVSRWLGLERGSPARIGVGIFQVIALGYLIGITVGSVRKLDELQYRIQLEAIAFAFTLSAIVMTGWSFLAKAGLPEITWGSEVWLLMVVAWALGLGVTRRRYR